MEAEHRAEFRFYQALNDFLTNSAAAGTALACIGPAPMWTICAGAKPMCWDSPVTAPALAN